MMRATTKVGLLPVTFLLFGLSLCVSAQLDWPEYNQQCQDDAGPPFLDDEETFPNGGKYHDGSAAVPILQDGKCAPVMQNACQQRPTTIGAYLEGPIDCGDQGWYCRIIIEDGWDNIGLRADYNFGHCNSTENFEDAGTDKDGHCHGSSYDNTYYWWIRDHWHRQYNGRLRCCCGWYSNTATPEISPEPLYNGRIANRCDYRRLVTPTEDVSKCRDANEDHGLGFDDIGCNSAYSDQIGKPIPEDDSKCWEVSKFGDSGLDTTRAPTPASAAPTRSEGTEPTPPPVTDPTLPPVTDPTLPPVEAPSEDDCTQKRKTKFIIKRKNKKNLVKKCQWLENRNQKQKNNFCKRKKGTKKFDPPRVSCRITCGICDPDEDEDSDSGSGSDSDENADADSAEDEDSGNNMYIFD